MPSIFSRIAAREIPGHIIAEDEAHLAILDIRPLKRGHALAIPKREVDYIFDMEDGELAALMAFAKRVARAVEAVVPCTRMGIAVVGLEVPHTHIHLVPIRSVHDLSWANGPIEISDEELAELAVQIRAKLEA